jgi:hypothetical protein
MAEARGLRPEFLAREEPGGAGQPLAVPADLGDPAEKAVPGDDPGNGADPTGRLVGDPAPDGDALVHLDPLSGPSLAGEAITVW